MTGSWEERLARLEQHNLRLERLLRRWQRMGAAGLGVVGLILMAGLAQTDDRTIRGTRVVVVDAEGTERLVLAATKEGAGLRINGPDGTLRAALGEGKIPTQGDGSGLWILDKKGRPRVGLGVGDAEDQGGLVILDDQGKPVAPQGR